MRWLLWVIAIVLVFSPDRAHAKGRKQPKREPGCPASYAQATGLCGKTGQPSEWLSCAYPEGTCACALPSPCTGIPVEPPPPGTPIPWHCTPKPPKVRADGCPGVQPKPESACSHDGQRCSYGDCCFTVMSCERGRWDMGQMSCPPAAPPHR